ncbi:MAG: ATP-binding protein, partial [Muricauda sp.]|nr:ATP-binding protein [Allomuricauda sp.]
ISIADNGQGIAKEDIKKIFRKYFRIKNGDVHKVKGYGLGLYYVQKIIKMHRGAIQVQSEPGQGTTFTLSLKLTKHGEKI